MMNSDRHIRSAFDQDLKDVQAMVVKMGALVEAAIIDAAEALEQRNIDMASRVRTGDKQIDALEEQIQNECARLIALRAPIASDLRMVLTVMRISSILERCGDYAKNLAKRSLVLTQMPMVEGGSAAIKRMAYSVCTLLNDALESYITRDLVRASEVRLRDREIDQMYNSVFREFLTYMQEDPRNITPCMHLHFIAKNIERIGDYATGIAEQVIYLIEGKLPDEARPKESSITLPPGSTA